MSTGPSRRLRHVLASLAARPEPAAKAVAIHDPSEPINRAADGGPQTLLSEAQVKAFVQHGFLALPCADLGDEWHRAFGERCYDTVYPDGAVEPTPADETRGWPASQPELAELVGSPSVSGALTSLLGEGWVHHPNRMMQYPAGLADHVHDFDTGDQTFHKDQVYASSVRFHTPRWLIAFYFPRGATNDMGPSAIMPGSVYTSLDHSDRSVDLINDSIEDYQIRPGTVEAKTRHVLLQAREGLFQPEPDRPLSDQLRGVPDAVIDDIQPLLGEESTSIKDSLRGEVEQAAVDTLGVGLPRDDEEDLTRRSLFGENFKVLAPPGTLLLMHYNVAHRGTRRLAHSRWRPMIKLKFFRASAPSAPSWDTAGAGLTDPEPFSETGASAAEQQVWTSTLAWMKGQRGAPESDSLRAEDGRGRADTVTRGLATTLHECALDFDRLGAAYALGRLAQSGSREALAALEDALSNGRDDLVHHAAMHGLAVAADAAVPCLQAAVSAGTAALSPASRDSADAEVSAAWCGIVRSVWALGEGAHSAPFDGTVETLGSALATTMDILQGSLEAAKREDSSEVERHDHALSSHGLAIASESRFGLTDYLGLVGLQHRAVAACVQALRSVGERVAAAGDDDNVRRILELLLPLTVQPEVMLEVPPETLYTGLPASRYWISEGAALGVLSLCSAGCMGGSVSVPSPIGDRWSARPASLCLLALERCRASQGAALAQLEHLEGEWQRAHEAEDASESDRKFVQPAVWA